MKNLIKKRWMHFSIVEHLALYQMFHQHPTNRLLHHWALPLIFYSGFIPLVMIKFSFDSYGVLFCNAGLVLFVFTLLCFAQLDRLITFVFGLWVLPLYLLALWTVTVFPPLWCGGMVLLGQALGWYLAVVIGHEQTEPTIEYDGRPVSTNIYFEKQMFYLRNTGKAATFLDAWLQFAIGPFHTSFEMALLLRQKTTLKEVVDQQMEVNLQRFAEGFPLYKSTLPLASF